MALLFDVLLNPQLLNLFLPLAHVADKSYILYLAGVLDDLLIEIVFELPVAL